MKEICAKRKQGKKEIFELFKIAKNMPSEVKVNINLLLL